MLDACLPGCASTFSPLNDVGRPDGTWVVFRRAAPNETPHVYRDEQSVRAATATDNVYLKDFAGSPSERFEFLGRRVFGGMSCRGGGESRRDLCLLYRAAYQEAKDLAATQQQRCLSFMRVSAKRVWSAPPRNSVASDSQVLPVGIDHLTPGRTRCPAPRSRPHGG